MFGSTRPQPMQQHRAANTSCEVRATEGGGYGERSAHFRSDNRYRPL